MTTVQDDSTLMGSRIAELLEKVPSERHELALAAISLYAIALQPFEPDNNSATLEQWQNELQENLGRACFTAYLFGLQDGEKKARENLE